MHPEPRATPTFEFETVVARCLGNQDLAVRLLHRFGEQLGEDVPRLTDAVSRSASEEVVQAAHRIKGAAASLGIEGVRQMAAWIESAARAGSLSGNEEHLRTLEDEVRRYRTDVKRLAPRDGEAGGS